jgi:hypothetical protein
VNRKNKLGFERKSPTDEAALERADRLANLLTLSYEPMLASRLDGPIEFWNAGVERLYGFAQGTKRSDVQATLCRRLNFQLIL